MKATIPIVDPAKGYDQEIQWITEAEWPEACAAGRLRAELFYLKFEADAALKRRAVEAEVVRRRLPQPPMEGAPS